MDVFSIFKLLNVLGQILDTCALVITHCNDRTDKSNKTVVTDKNRGHNSVTTTRVQDETRRRCKMQDAKCKMQNAKCKIQDARCKTLNDPLGSDCRRHVIYVTSTNTYNGVCRMLEDDFRVFFYRVCIGLWELRC